ncbi:hypothetical protein A6A04_13530 [Paramagnetospirillum marisnigri]|uniref:Uncharacterized protein n=2 Tax=Paramagnetospirillum marisnigri TaxID=1285242 RepID=A0A178MV11_9PROT|nr:hypothetical protein A6A04_13530 [Paramagnetospirillum marisnigri]
MLPNPRIILGGLLAIIGAALGGYFYGQHVEALTWEAAIAAQKVEAATILQAETERAVAAERAWRRVNDEMEISHAKGQAALDQAYDDARRSAAAGGGLRDPGRGKGGGRSVPTATGAACLCQDGATAPRLSAEAEDFLWRFARDADAAAQFASECRAWAMTSGDHPAPPSGISTGRRPGE